MGWRVRRTCYGNPEDARQALVSEFPYFDSSGNDTYSVTTSSINATGLVTIGIRTNAGGAATRTVQLDSCTSSFAVSSTDGILMVVAFIAVWALGVIGGLKR